MKHLTTWKLFEASYVKYKDLNESFEQSDWNEVNGKLKKDEMVKDI